MITPKVVPSISEVAHNSSAGSARVRTSSWSGSEMLLLVRAANEQLDQKATLDLLPGRTALAVQRRAILSCLHLSWGRAFPPEDWSTPEVDALEKIASIRNVTDGMIRENWPNRKPKDVRRVIQIFRQRQSNKRLAARRTEEFARVNSTPLVIGGLISKKCLRCRTVFQTKTPKLHWLCDPCKKYVANAGGSFG